MTLAYSGYKINVIIYSAFVMLMFNVINLVFIYDGPTLHKSLRTGPSKDGGRIRHNNFYQIKFINYP